MAITINGDCVYSPHVLNFGKMEKPGAMPGLIQLLTMDKKDKSSGAEKLSRAVVMAQEKECYRIGSELHDNINQLILTARMHVAMVRRKIGECDTALEMAEQYLSEAIEGIKQLTRRLDGSMEARGGLEHSIAGIVESMNRLHVHVYTTVSSRLVSSLEPEQQLMVYRVIQEQTSNILQHSGAMEAYISLKQKGGDAELVIMDSGRGFDTAVKTGGIGFNNITNRARSMKGRAEWVSYPGEGCTLTVTFPLNQENKICNNGG